MEFSEIQDHVTGYLLDAVTSTNTLVPTLINKAIYDAERMKYNFQHMEEVLEATTVDGEQVLAGRPALWKRSRMKPWIRRDDGERTELEWTDRQEAWRWYPLTTVASTGHDTPEVVLVDATQVLLYPEPDDGSDWSDGDYRMSIPYYAYSADLSADDDTNWWTLNAPWYVIFQAVSEGMLRNRDEQRAGLYAGKARAEYQIAKRADTQSKTPERSTLIPRRGAFARIRQPRRL